jgi:GT2 family glycosyltransferase
VISVITLTRESQATEARLGSNLTLALGQQPDGFPTGHAWELIVSNGNNLDILEGYNWGASQAQYDNLLFIHDDVRILGNPSCFDRPLDLLKKPMTGVVGCAGARLLPKDATWWNAPNEECWGMVAHPTKQGDFGIHWNTWPHHQARFGRVAVLDGCFLMMSRRFFEKMGGFDSKNYKGYHFYDVDLSFRACLQGFVNYSAPIPISHRSRGAVNENWEENRKKFLELHGKHLPYVIKD